MSVTVGFRLLSIFFLLAFAPAAFAQAPQPEQQPATPEQQPATPEQQAAQFMVSQLTNEKMGLLTQVATDRGQITELRKQIADLTNQLTEAKKLASTESQKK